MRFIKKSDCYLDTKTGLEWALRSYRAMSWEEALGLCVNLEGSWGLPSIEELLSLVDYTEFNPATELPGMLSSHYYWSSSPYAGNSNEAWYVHFYYGYPYTNNKDKDFYRNLEGYEYYVRAVRNGARRLK